MYDLTGDEDPQQQQFQQRGGGFGFPGGGFGFPGGINIEDLMRGGGFFQGGGRPGGHQQHQQRGHHQQHQQRGQQQRQKRGQGRASYSFSFGGNEGMRF